MHLFSFFASLLTASAFAIPVDEQQIPFIANAINDERTLVPVTLGVMSRCPDAHACEASSDRVFGSRSSQGVIRDLVQPELVFIGKLNNESVPFGVDCMHGSQECRGNVQTLCMQDNHEWKTWWPFVQCLGWSSKQIGDESLARQCASLSKVDWDPIQKCVDGPRGAELLQASVKEAQNREIEKSCSVFINHRLVCVRDGGQWKDCVSGHEVSDFAQQISRAYDALN